MSFLDKMSNGSLFPFVPPMMHANQGDNSMMGIWSQFDPALAKLLFNYGEGDPYGQMLGLWGQGGQGGYGGLLGNRYKPNPGGGLSGGVGAGGMFGG